MPADLRILEKVLAQIRSTTDQDVPFMPELLFFDFWPKMSLPKSTRDLISTLLVAAKSAITITCFTSIVISLALQSLRSLYYGLKKQT